MQRRCVRISRPHDPVKISFRGIEDLTLEKKLGVLEEDIGKYLFDIEAK